MCAGQRPVLSSRVSWAVPLCGWPFLLFCCVLRGCVRVPSEGVSECVQHILRFAVGACTRMQKGHPPY
jgi:hypothetical protein